MSKSGRIYVLYSQHVGRTDGFVHHTGRLDLALNSSFTVCNGQSVLWYPEKKFFLLGRIIGPEWFER